MNRILILSVSLALTSAGCASGGASNSAAGASGNKAGVKKNWKYGTSSDRGKEKRWADQVVDSIMVGDAAWLTVGKRKILGIYSGSEAKKIRGGAVIIHGLGVHPNWGDVIQPLRSKLPEAGWHTLSIQMPILHNEAKFADYEPLMDEVAPRINAAIRYLKGKGVKRIVLIGHSLGAGMGVHYMGGSPDPSVRGVVAIAMNGQTPKNSPLNFPAALSRIKVPVLDLYGEKDLADVKNTAKTRAQAASGNKGYKQVQMPGMGHFFRKSPDALVRAVGKWIGALP